MFFVTGFIAQTSGFIYYHKRDFKKCMNLIRKSIGFSPGFRLLLPYLSVKEHLYLYGFMRGMNTEDVKNDTYNILRKLNILRRANVMTSKQHLTTNQNACVAGALIGNRQFLIFDEPTKALNADTKREFWDYLIRLKEKRTIIITLTDIQEAEIYADRILILHDGRLICFGSPVFIEQYFHTGYMLSIYFPLAGFNSMKATNIIRNRVPQAKLHEIIPGCVTFSLGNVPSIMLVEILNYLETNKSELGIIRFNLSLLNINEVFERSEEIADKFLPKLAENDKNLEVEMIWYQDNIESLKPFPLFLQQLKGLFLKRYYYMRHAWVLHLLAFFCPIVYELTLGKMLRDACGPPPNISFNINLSQYQNPHAVYSTNSNYTMLGNNYKKIIEENFGTSEKVLNVSEAIISYGLYNISFYHKNLIVGSELNSTDDNYTINALYGNLPQHGPPISLNLATISLIRTVTKNENYSISVTNNPLPRSEEDYFEIFNLRMIIICSVYGMVISILVPILHTENIIGLRHIQHMIGVSRPTYFFSQLSVDLLFCGATCVVTLTFIYFTDYSPLSIHAFYFVQVSNTLFTSICI